MKTPYSLLADEYYDSILHPTCANFEELSRKFLEPRITGSLESSRVILETGAGRSMVAPIVQKSHGRHDLTLLDSSSEMLSNSAEWSLLARLLVADSQSTELSSESFDLIVSSLGDPYNTQDFWNEVFRLLKPGAICLFTTPAPEWALRFRKADHRTEAEFVRSDGGLVNVPSFVPEPQEQALLFSNARLKVEESRDFDLSILSGPISPKLKIQNDWELSQVVLRGFRLRKSD